MTYRKDIEIAARVADMYLEKFPRAQSYAVKLVSSYSFSEWTTYHLFTPEEHAALRKCSVRAAAELCSLQEVFDKGYAPKELVEKLFENVSVYDFDKIESVDLDNPRKLTNFGIQIIDRDGKLGPKEFSMVELSDDEYKEILSNLLANANHYSINMMVFEKPELAQKIMKRLAFIEEGSHLVKDPFLVDMVELSLDAESILNPFVDVLGLFNEGSPFRDFAVRNQVGPVYGVHDIYSMFTKEGHHHVIMRFVGRKVVIEQIASIPNINEAYFEVDAKTIMDKYGLNTPEEIYPYLKEHFNRKNCFKVLRKDLFGL